VIAEAGHYALVLALALGLMQSTLPILGARWRDPVLMNVARSTALAQLPFVAFSFAALVALHVISDFSVVNVFENSHSLKPLIYKITGVWGNHEGSTLLWVSISFVEYTASRFLGLDRVAASIAKRISFQGTYRSSRGMEVVQRSMIAR
jgi:cytochrome c biogenesis factor